MSIISAEPDVTIRPVQGGDVAVVLACDGVFDVMSDDEVARVVLAHDDPAECEHFCWITYICVYV